MREKTLTVKHNAENTGVLPTLNMATPACWLKPWMFAEHLLKPLRQPGYDGWLHCCLCCGERRKEKKQCWEELHQECLEGKCSWWLKSYSAESRWGWMVSPFQPYCPSVPVQMFPWDGLRRHHLGVCLSCIEKKHMKGARFMYCCYVFPSFRAFLAITGRYLSRWSQALSSSLLPFIMLIDFVTPPPVAKEITLNSCSLSYCHIPDLYKQFGTLRCDGG